MATSSHQPTAPPSKRQKPSLQGEEAVAKNDGVDRISDLPDCLLCHILSFLPTTRQAVATSILSSRWKTLWTFVPCLYLKPWPWPTWNHPESVPFSFSHILSRVFAQHKKAPYLRKFHLHAEYPCDDCNAFHAGSYITAISPNLEELNLSICAESDPVEHNYSGPMLELPLSIFSCKNLVFLKLSGRIPFNLPSSFKLPSLKILHLLLNLYNDDSDWRLLSGCPVLEELYICRDGENHRKVVKFKIFVPTLKRLEMDFFVGEFDHPDYDIEINAPALEYFHFSGDLRSLVFSEKLSCLVEANVDVCPLEYYGYGKDYGDYGDSLVVLLRELYNVKVLSLSMDTTECLSLPYDYDLPMFHNLTRFNYLVNCCNWHVLPHLLDQAPNLKDLVVDKSFSSILNAHESCQKEPLYVPSDLSPHLATFCFKGFEGLKDELKFVRCILKKSRVLKKMTFKYGGSYRNAVVEKSHILKKVLNLPRRSMSCQIAFE